MAMQAMDASSSTGDFIVETMTITGEEVGTIVANTAETFTTEVTRAYNETTAAFEDDMKKAEDAIADAKKELQEAINKLNECSAAANAAAEALRAAQEAEAARASYGDYENAPGSSGGGSGDSSSATDWRNATSLYALVNGMGVDHNALDDISNKLNGDQESIAMINQMMYKHPSKE